MRLYDEIHHFFTFICKVRLQEPETKGEGYTAKTQDLVILSVYQPYQVLFYISKV
jgi:hypothetical protein